MAKKKKLTKKQKKYLAVERRLSRRLEDCDEEMRTAVINEYIRKENMRKFFVTLCAIVAIGSLGYFFTYSYQRDKNIAEQNRNAAIKEKDGGLNVNPYIKPVVRVEDNEEKKVFTLLPEYETMYNKNRSLVGWVKILDTNIDYPVMQSPDPEYYLTHNIEQQYDKNGSIFMDPACDIKADNDNLIIYGHHMKSGNMFGNLNKYADPTYAKAHEIIYFDTIYERGKYKVVYVFKDQIKQEAEITFKYYQFITAESEADFDYNIKNMKEISIYSSGEECHYGDKLLTLSTCDRSEENGRFVVVAKKFE